MNKSTLDFPKSSEPLENGMSANVMHKQPPLTTDLYFEAHVTMTPLSAVQHQSLKAILPPVWRVADFNMAHVGAPEAKAFVSMRSTSYLDIVTEVRAPVLQLKWEGFTVTRAKIENTLHDSNHDNKEWLSGVL